MTSTLNNRQLGELEFENGYAGTHVTVGGRTVELDVYFEEGEPNPEALDRLAAILSNLELLEEHARSAIKENLAEDGAESALRQCRQYQFDELEPATLQRLFGTESAAGLTDDRHLAAFALTHIGVHPEHEDAAVNCDFRVGPEAEAPHMISVMFDAEGHAEDVSLEHH